MSGRVVLEADGVGKLYRRMAAGFRLRTLKSALLDGSLVKDLAADEAIEAVSGVSFQVREGEAFGVIGGNGSGKSTLLKLVAGIIQPSFGAIRVDGRVAALIELGAGFHPEISGRENVYINGAVLGLTRKQIDRRFDEIVEFSGLEDFIEEPVKNYSSGMYVRLGFAVAIHTDPDILLVDEVLAVGDEAFAHRCLRRIEEFLARGKTLLFVSHSLSLVESVCDRVLWLDHGEPRLLGSPRRVSDAYRQAVAEAEGRVHQRDMEEQLAVEEAEHGELTEPASESGEGAAETVEAPEDDGDVAEHEPEPTRWGSGAAEIQRVRLLVAGEERYHVRSGEAVAFQIEASSREELTDFVFGIGIYTPRGVECWGTNTDLAGFASRRFSGSATVRIECPDLRLAPGEYTVDIAVHARDGAPYDYRRHLLTFSVTSAERGIGVYFPEHRWSFEGLEWRPTGRRNEVRDEGEEEA